MALLEDKSSVSRYEVEYDRRQFGLMAETVQQFEKGKLDVGALAFRLTALLDALQAAQDDWKNKFRANCNTLDYLYSEGVHREEKNSTPLEKTLSEPLFHKQIEESVTELKKLLARVYDSCP